MPKKGDDDASVFSNDPRALLLPGTSREGNTSYGGSRSQHVLERSRQSLQERRRKSHQQSLNTATKALMALNCSEQSKKAASDYLATWNDSPCYALRAEARVDNDNAKLSAYTAARAAKGLLSSARDNDKTYRSLKNQLSASLAAEDKTMCSMPKGERAGKAQSRAKELITLALSTPLALRTRSALRTQESSLNN